MRIRTLVSSAAVITAFITSSALVSDAMAQKGTFMSPSTKWTVTKVDSTAAPYCAMAQRFNQSTVLTVARNQDSETSFAIDFNQPLFRSGAPVSVVLDPGAGQMRSYTIKPVSNKAFVVRLGDDEQFFSALERTGVLRLEVGQGSYHFNLADIAKGDDKLNSCIATMIMPAAGDEDVGVPAPIPAVETAGAGSGPTPAPTASSGSTSARLEINALRRQIKSLEQENKALELRLDTRGESVSESSEAVVQLSNQIQTLRNEKAALQKQLELAAAPELSQPRSKDFTGEVEALRAENARLQAQIQTAAPNDEFVASLETEIAALKSQNEKLQVAINERGGDESQVARLRQQIAGLEQENTQLNEKILTARQKFENEYSAEIVKLQSENRTLRANMDQGANVDVALLDQLRAQIAQAENENRLLKQTAVQAVEQNMGTQNAAALDVVRAENAAQIAKLESEIRKLKTENAKQAGELVAVGADSIVLEDLKVENAALKADLAALDTQDTQSLEARIAELEGDNKDLMQQLADASAVKPTADIDALAALQAENERLEKALVVAEGKTEILAELQNQIETLKADNQKLTSSVSDDSVQKELEAALEQNALLQEQISEKDAQLAEMEGLRQELATLNSAKTQDMQALAEANTEAEEKIAALQAKQDEMKKVLADVVAVAENYKSDIAEKDSLIEELKATQVASTDIEAESATPDYEIALEERQREIASLQEQVDQLAIENKELRERQDSEVETQVVEAEVTEPKAEAAQDDVAAFTETLKQVAGESKEESEPQNTKVAAAQDVPVKAKPKKPVKKAKKAAPKKKMVASEPAFIDDARSAAARKELYALEHQIATLDVDQLAEKQNLVRKYMVLKSRIEQYEREVLIPKAQGEMPSSQKEARVMTPEAPSDDMSVKVPEQRGADVEVINYEPLEVEQTAGLTEAQIQERAIKQGLQQREQLVAKAQEEQIVMRQAQDPFEDLSVQKPEDTQEIETPRVAEWEEGLPRNIVAPEDREDGIEVVEMRSPPPASNAPVRSAKINKAPVESSNLRALVVDANVTAPESIKVVQNISGETLAAYKWNGGSIYGSAEQEPLASAGQFDRKVQDYFERTEARCPREFAIVPNDTVERGGVRADSYEVACVGSNVNSAASILFFNKDGKFTVVAHEAPAEELSTAMDQRNKFKRLVTGS